MHGNIIYLRGHFVVLLDGMLEPDSGSRACLWYPGAWPGLRKSLILHQGDEGPERERNSPKVIQEIRAELGPVPLIFTKKLVSERNP